MKPLCLDSNVLIASIKDDEKHSKECRDVIKAVAEGKFYLVEPAICLTEVIGNVTKLLGSERGRAQETFLRSLVSIWEVCDEAFCTKAAYTVAAYKIYSMDSLFLETALKYNATLVSLDEEDFVSKIKDKAPIEVYHPKNFQR